MFAKLKKKVIEENGGRGIEGGDRSLSTSPGAVPSLPGSTRHNSGEGVGEGDAFV